MTTFVLVHGSGQSAGSWSRVGEVLQAEGHRVVAPDLPKSAPDWRLVDYATAIASEVTEPEAVVVAHSMSGAFLPLIPEQTPCAHLVYLAAVIPEPGKSLRQQFTEQADMFAPDWIAAGARWFEGEEHLRIAREFMYSDYPPDLLEWALGVTETTDTRHLATEVTPLSQQPSRPTTSIVASRDRTISPEWGRRNSRQLLQVTAIEMAAGHCPHMSHPRELARLLTQL